MKCNGSKNLMFIPVSKDCMTQLLKTKAFINTIVTKNKFQSLSVNKLEWFKIRACINLRQMINKTGEWHNRIGTLIRLDIGGTNFFE